MRTADFPSLIIMINGALKMSFFENFSLPDLLRAARYCQKNAEGKRDCTECSFFKRDKCPGDETRTQNVFFEDLLLEQQEQM